MNEVVQKRDENALIYERISASCRNKVDTLSNPGRVTTFLTSWQSEIDSRAIDRTTLIKRERALALSRPFVSDDEPTTADTLSALYRWSNPEEQLDIADAMELLGASSALHTFRQFRELEHSLEQYRPTISHEDDQYPSFSWFFWQMDNVKEHLKIMAEAFELEHFVARALYTTGNETIVVEGQDKTWSFKPEALVEERHSIFQMANAFLARFPANPLAVEEIFKDEQAVINRRPSSEAWIQARIADRLTHLEQSPLMPDLTRDVLLQNRTMASELEAINRLRKYYQSSTPPFSPAEKLHWFGRSAFWMVSEWTTPMFWTRHNMKEQEIGDQDTLEIINTMVAEWDKNDMNQTFNIFDSISNLRGFRFLVEAKR